MRAGEIDTTLYIGKEKLKGRIAWIGANLELGELQGKLKLSPTYTICPKGSILKGKYRIIKVLMAKEDRATYLVKDINCVDKKYLLREFCPLSMEEEELSKRKEKFDEFINILTTFKHENLIEVYESFTENGREYCVTEYVEGIDLARLADMRISFFSEQEARYWGLALCKAIEFIHCRPEPFTLGELSPRRVMIQEVGDKYVVKIINYDLHRFFDPDIPSESMLTYQETLYEDITKVARIIYFLLTKKEYDPYDPEPKFPEGISEKIRSLLERTCRSGQKTIGSIRQFKEKLIQTEKVSEEDLPVKAKSRFATIPTIKSDLLSKINGLWSKFLLNTP